LEGGKMADTAIKVNGQGMTEIEIEKLVARELRWKEKNLRNKVANRLLKAKVKESGLVVTDAEIDAELARLKK
jgi:hypothetical protein